MASDRPRWVAPLAFAVAAIGTGIAAAWFWAHPSNALIGTTASELMVPWFYQACAFPPLGLLLTTALVDVLSARRTAGLSALALCAACSLVAIIRLAGLIPLSGHGLFLSAVIVFELLRGAERTPGAFLTAVLGLLVTGYFKLFVWHDGVFFAASVVLGGALAWAVSAMVLAPPRPGR